MAFLCISILHYKYLQILPAVKKTVGSKLWNVSRAQFSDTFQTCSYTRNRHSKPWMVIHPKILADCFTSFFFSHFFYTDPSPYFSAARTVTATSKNVAAQCKACFFEAEVWENWESRLGGCNTLKKKTMKMRIWKNQHAKKNSRRERFPASRITKNCSNGQFITLMFLSHNNGHRRMVLRNHAHPLESFLRLISTTASHRMGFLLKTARNLLGRSSLVFLW